MKAAVVSRYGPPEVMRIDDLPMPKAGTQDVLVRVAAAPVTSGDARIRGLDVPPGFGGIIRLVFGLTGPRHPVLGMSFAGRVQATGAAVSNFHPGQRVFGLAGLRGGSMAEYLCLPASGRLLPIPDSLTDIEAAAFFFGGLTAAGFLIDQGRLARGERLLVNGATGAVGSAAVQIARHLGAHVTARCSSAKAGIARDLGAEAVQDYETDAPGGPFDVILDVAGTLPWDRAAAHLAPGGRLLLVTAGLGQTIGAALRPRRGTARLAAGTVAEDLKAMQRLVDLHQVGAWRPLIGTTLPLDGIVEAHRIASARHKAGNLVIRIAPEATGAEVTSPPAPPVRPARC